MVKTVKKLLEHSADPHKAPFSYRATPLLFGLSPAELLMGRMTRADVAQLKSYFILKWEYLSNYKHLDEKYRKRAMTCHGVKTLSSLPEDTTVWVDNQGHKFGEEYYKELGHANPTFFKYPLENYKEIEYTFGSA